MRQLKKRAVTAALKDNGYACQLTILRYAILVEVTLKLISATRDEALLAFETKLLTLFLQRKKKRMWRFACG